MTNKCKCGRKCNCDKEKLSPNGQKPMTSGETEVEEDFIQL